MYINTRILDGVSNSTINNYRTAEVPFISVIDNNKFKIIYKMSSIGGLGYSVKTILIGYIS